MAEIEVVPSCSSPLYVDGTAVRSSGDDYHDERAVNDPYWQTQLNCVRMITRDGLPVTLVDIGANDGLFTRMTLKAFKLMPCAFLYEPNVDNYERAAFNLAPFARRVHLKCAGLADRTATEPFYLDVGNSGAHSFLRDAVTSEACFECRGELLDVQEQAELWIAEPRPIFYKSDAQAYDELIIGRLDLDFWRHVVGGIVELWRMPKPEFNRDRFCAMLGLFPGRVMLKSNRHCTVTEIMDYLDGQDGAWDDLAFWK
jgi:FkbM family methyltransferase